MYESSINVISIFLCIHPIWRRTTGQVVSRRYSDFSPYTHQQILSLPFTLFFSFYHQFIRQHESAEKNTARGDMHICHERTTAKSHIQNKRQEISSFTFKLFARCQPIRIKMAIGWYWLNNAIICDNIKSSRNNKTKRRKKKQKCSI